MGFYNDLSDFYDEVFAVSEAELRFVSDSLPTGARLLDVGCGTGNKTVVFAKHAEAIVGIEPDKSMVARAKTYNKSSNIEYRQGGMEELSRLFQPRSFSAITCLGNTLVHLTSLSAIRLAVQQMYELLAPGGVFVGQILHYDYIIAHQVVSLPVLETDNIRFERAYDLSAKPITFITDIYDKKKATTLHNETLLYPLTQGEFQNILEEAGFTRIEFFGSYAGEPLKENSLPLIVRCYRQG